MKSMKEPREKDHRRMSKPELAERLRALLASSGARGGRNVRENEFQAVLHELEVYQIELEMQVRELNESRQALEESHSRYINLYDFAPVGYITLSDQGMIKEINLTAAGILGVERQWLEGRSLAPWVFSADLPLFRAHLKQCREGGGKVQSVLRLIRRDRRPVPVELSTACGIDLETGTYLFRTAVTDLTERRKTEAELDQFFNLSTDLICIAGNDGYFKRVNPAFERTLGYSRAELLARPFLEFAHPEDRDAGLAEFYRVIRGGVSTTDYRIRYIRKDRSIVRLAWNAIASGESLYCVARDITAEIEAREIVDNQHQWLKEMVERIPVALYVVEAKTGTLVSTSASSEPLFKEFPRTTADIPRSRSFFADSQGRRLPPESWPRMRAAKGEELNSEPFIWQSPRGISHFLISTRSLPAKYGRPAMGIVSTQDVTHLKHVESALNEAVETLEQERDLRERFVSTLTHDLRQPLSGLKMSAQLMLRSPENAASTARLSERVLKNADRIDHMIGDLLDANRIRAGEKLPLSLSRFDLASLVKETLDELSATHGARFVFDCSAPVLGRWSKSGLRRVIENLVVNAVKYGSPERPIRVSVAMDSKPRVVISVQNFGNPIPKDDQATLFDQFRRARDAEAGAQKGWGLGLTLVKGTVEAHGGEVTVESSEEYGTVFRVVLPLEGVEA